jgi:UDP-3-O-[3-hydroxymyristoyl] glucosamine N-acyltransferase
VSATAVIDVCHRDYGAPNIGVVIEKLVDRKKVRIHASADVSDLAHIVEGSSIWHQAQVHEHARIGRGCILDKDGYQELDVVLP